MNFFRKPIFYVLGLILKTFKIPSPINGHKVYFPANMKIHELGETLTNTYEKDERKLVNKYLKPHHKVLELGACIGVVSLSINKILYDKKNQVSVEPNPQMLNYLKKIGKAIMVSLVLKLV